MIATSFFISLICLFIPKELNKRPLIIVSLCVTAATSLLIGPSAMLHLPDKEELVLAGLITFGVAE